MTTETQTYEKNGAAPTPAQPAGAGAAPADTVPTPAADREDAAAPGSPAAAAKPAAGVPDAAAPGANGPAAATPAVRGRGQRLALYGLLTCVALVAGYVEALIPLPVTVPGVKLGLGNAVVLFGLKRLGVRPALYLMLAKVLCAGLLFANPSMMLYSLAGGVLSWALMALACKSGWFSTLSVSVIGGVAHNAGQLLLVAAWLSPAVALFNAPVLAVSGVVAGLAVGVLTQLALRAVPQDR